MKKTNNTIMTVIAGVALTLGLTLASCAKKGDTGPAGPAGTNGTNGNANVKSMSMTVVSSSWIYDATNKVYRATIIDVNITQDIVNTGAVMVYIVSGGTNLALPVTVYPSTAYSETFSFTFSLNTLVINVQDSDLTQPNNPGAYTFKIVKIAASGRMANPNVNYNDYNAVKKAFNLQD